MKDKKVLFYETADRFHTIWQEIVANPPKGYEFIMPEKTQTNENIKNLGKSKIVKFFYRNFFHHFVNPLEIIEKSIHVPENIDLIYSPERLVTRPVPWVCDVEVALSFAGHNNSLLQKNRKKIEMILSSEYCKKIMPFTNFGKKTIEKEFDTSLFKDKIEVVHFAADIPKLTHKRNTKMINIIFVGTANQKDPMIFNIKGGREAIEAFRILSKKYSNIRMKIISNIPENIDVKIDRLDVIPLMPREKLFKLYSESDIFLAPTYFNLGMSFVEAMGCGLPIITTDMFGLPEAVDKNGFIIKMKDQGVYKERSAAISEFPEFTKFLYEKNSEQIIKGIVYAVSALVENTKIIDIMSRASREKYEKEFSMEYKKRKLKEIFDAAINSQS